MTYIFDVLMENHQFELLFKKGSDKVMYNVYCMRYKLYIYIYIYRTLIESDIIQEEKLRLAILDYLDRLHPTDQDTFTIVTLHFTMYREIAHMLEEAAKARLRTLYQTPIGKYGGAGTSIGNYANPGATMWCVCGCS